VLPRGIIKASPEDFVVEELPLYEPSGEGDHLYVRFTKRNLPTDAAVRAIARALRIDTRDVGVAGLKDKVGVTTQTISVPVGRDPTFEARARDLGIDGITIHSVRRHTNKLRTGHLAGNRFTIVVRAIEGEVEEAVRSLERVGREGAPNAFGSQRFGREGDNAARARAWLRGEWSGPRDGRARRFLWSSLQSAIYNDVLRRRVADGTWTTPVPGDLLQKEDSGGLFLCADVQEDRARAERGEVSPTGPIVGIKMRGPEGAPLALEQEVTTAWLGDSFDFAGVRQLGEGARRPFRTIVRDLRVQVDSGEQGPSVRVCFVLPKGAYATTVLSAAFTIDAFTTDEVSGAAGPLAGGPSPKGETNDPGSESHPEPDPESDE
jgi:tRNA pseudouridine13 synthase